MPGFRDCFVVDVAPQLGIRQTRLLEGLYVVTKEDVTERRHFADSVARGRDYYTPYRSLLPREVKGLIVAGRHYSATSSAQRMSREIPPCMAMGEAAGEAAALALEGGVALDRVDVGKLQSPSARPRRRSGRPAGGQRHRPEGRRMTVATQPLTGIKVLDFTQVMMGPCATQMLADYGADVIKIERPGAGDLSRTSLADDPDGLNNPVFRSLNRNKRSIALDLRGEAGKAIVYDLVKTADVVVNNFRAGVMDRMGFGYEALSKINPRIICAFGSGFGQSGPLSHKGGQDILAQALSGVMARKPDQSLPTSVYATALADYSAGMHLVQGILLALDAAREDRRRPVALGVALRFHARHADAGSGDVAAAQARAELGRLPADRRVRDHRRRGGDRRRLQGQSAAGYLPRARACPICRPIRATPPSPSRWRTRRNCTACSAASSRPTRRRTGSPGSRSRISCARRCRPWARRWPPSRPQVNNMVVSLDANGSGRNEPLKLVASPITMDASAFQLRHAPPGLGEHGTEILGELGYAPTASPSCARARCFHDHPLRRGEPRRARHDRPSRPHERHRRGVGSRADAHLVGHRSATRRCAASCSPAPASAPSAPAPT